MITIAGYQWPEHRCVEGCLCQAKLPNNPKPFLIMRIADDSLEHDASSLFWAKSYIEAFDRDAHVYIWDTISNRVL